MTMTPRLTYRAAPGGFHPGQWVVVSNAPGAAAIMVCETQGEAEQEAARLNAG